jgi:hypothetical protein
MEEKYLHVSYSNVLVIITWKKNINKIMFGNNIQDKMIFSVSYLVIVSKT